MASDATAPPQPSSGKRQAAGDTFGAVATDERGGAPGGNTRQSSGEARHVDAWIRAVISRNIRQAARARKRRMRLFGDGALFSASRSDPLEYRLEYRVRRGFLVPYQAAACHL